jgi:hypothetical protein
MNITPTFTGYNGASNTDDGDSGPVPIGFGFNFYCGTFSNVIICSNGFIQFDYMPIVWSAAVVHPTQTWPDANTPNGMVSFNMTDLWPGVGGSVNYTTVGTAPNRMFIVTFTNVPCFTTTSDLNSGQIVLYESTNIIEIHTGEAHGDSNQSGKGTQGIETYSYLPSPAQNFLSPTGRNGGTGWFPGTGTAYRFIPVGPTAPSPITGNTVLCQGDVSNYLISSSPGATLYTWTPPSGWAGTSTTTAVTFTSNVSSGVMSVTATYSCGTSSPSTLNVQVNPSPVISIQSVTPSVLCSGATVTFNLAGAAQYTIMPGNIQGAGQPPMTDTPLSSTVYSVTGTSSAGCVSQNTAIASVNVNQTPTVTINSGSICLGSTFSFTFSGATNYNYGTPFPQLTPSVAGIYMYTVTGETNGCTSAPATATVTVHPEPTVTATSSRTNICKGESTTLNGGGAVSYTWSPGSFTTSAISVTPVVNGNYVVTGVSQFGCKNSATISLVVNLCNGLSALDNGRSLVVYPNPVQRFLTVESPGNAAVVVYDISGKEVLRTNVAAGTSQLDVSGLPSGRYVLESTDGKNSGRAVIVKE